MYRYLRTLILSTVALLLIGPELAGARTANYLFGVQVPAGGMELGRPTGMFFDPRSQELFVADATNDRVVIFDRAGNYHYEFTDRARLTGPEQVFVDSLGRVFVLSSGNRSILSVFDYDGSFLYHIELVNPRSHSALEVVSVTLDEQDRVYALCLEPLAIYVFTTDGGYVRDFPLFTELDAEFRNRPITGNLALVYGELLIPMPVLGQIVRYTPEGKLAGLFGHSGSTSGGLGFPVAVGSDGQGGYLVLDKNRHSLMRFSRDGEFVKEYGGLGISPGWFYHPGFLATGPEGEIFVSQFYKSRVQALSVEPAALETNPAVITATGKEGSP